MLELGSGPGFLAEALLAAEPALDLTLLDFSLAMHDLARRRLGDVAASVRFVHRDMLDSDWSAGLGAFDAVVTLQAVHELRHKRRAPRLHSQVRSTLKPNGVYLVCDHLGGPGGNANTELCMDEAEHVAALKAAGFSGVRKLRREGSLLLLLATG